MMEQSRINYLWSFFVLILTFLVPLSVTAQEEKIEGYVLEIESDIAMLDSIHFGDGLAIGYSFFNDVEGFNYVFRKRVLKPGSQINYHLQEADEIYYILSGRGEMTINGKAFSVEAGQAILTRPGNYHGLKQTHDEDLILLIMYEKH
jgi:mannose-6-phosphate isomerase-like protein (cupin superfamily)